MRPAHIRQLERLRRDLLADGYAIDIKIRTSHDLLLFIVTMKAGDEAQLIETWDKVRRTE